MTHQHHSYTHQRNPTKEGYHVLFLTSSKNGGPEDFSPIPSGELYCVGQLHRTTLVLWVFCGYLWVLWLVAPVRVGPLGPVAPTELVFSFLGVLLMCLVK